MTLYRRSSTSSSRASRFARLAALVLASASGSRLWASRRILLCVAVCVGLGGSLHEYMAHECAKSSLAFRKPAVTAASRRPARADGPKVGLDGPASLGAGRAPCWSVLRGALWAGSATSAPEAQKAMFVAAADHSTLPGPR